MWQLESFAEHYVQQECLPIYMSSNRRVMEDSLPWLPKTQISKRRSVDLSMRTGTKMIFHGPGRHPPEVGCQLVYVRREEAPSRTAQQMLLVIGDACRPASGPAFRIVISSGRRVGQRSLRVVCQSHGTTWSLVLPVTWDHPLCQLWDHPEGPPTPAEDTFGWASRAAGEEAPWRLGGFGGAGQRGASALAAR